jgi:hypothetical protein
VIAFEYSEICIIQTPKSHKATFRIYGKSYEEVDNPFDYMGSLGLQGWEMVNVSMADNGDGSIKIYTFKREL